MDAQAIDPCDTGIEWDADIYRVYFWSTDGGRCDEYELSDAQDVREVIAWVDSHAGNRVLEIFARHDHPPEQGLIRLAGQRPGVA